MDSARPTIADSVQMSCDTGSAAKTFTVGRNFKPANTNADVDARRRHRRVPDYPLATGDGHS
jgi:hypothetical protein